MAPGSSAGSRGTMMPSHCYKQPQQEPVKLAEGEAAAGVLMEAGFSNCCSPFRYCLLSHPLVPLSPWLPVLLPDYPIPGPLSQPSLPSLRPQCPYHPVSIHFSPACSVFNSGTAITQLPKLEAWPGFLSPWLTSNKPLSSTNFTS